MSREFQFDIDFGSTGNTKTFKLNLYNFSILTNTKQKNCELRLFSCWILNLLTKKILDLFDLIIKSLLNDQTL